MLSSVSSPTARRERVIATLVAPSRRQVLALGALAASAGAVGVGVGGLRWWSGPKADGLAHLTPDEAHFVRAFSAACYPATRQVPHSGDDLDLDVYIDASLEIMAPTQRGLIRALLHGLDAWTFPKHASRFTDLDLSTRQDVLQHWLTHSQGEVRQATTSLVLLVGMGYSTHPLVAPFFERLHRCGYGR